MFRLLLGAATLICAAASPPFSKRAFGVTTDPSVANGQTFDFIRPEVLLVEAGADDRGDSRVYDIYAYGQAFGTSLDWQWPTEHGTMVSGKTLGGSSSINGGHYTRGLAAQYDAWSTLLESSEAGVGWNWNGMFNYMKKSEGFSGPNGQQSDKGAQANDAYHGFNGPVQVTFPDAMYGGPQQPAFIDTITSLTGMTHCPDLNGGNPNCVSMTPFTMNWHAADHRSSAPEAYLSPVEGIRTTWVTLTRHQVTKINWANSGSIPLRASGIEFAPASGGNTRYTASARREVIVAAGAIMTPQLLQLSGIGDSSILGPLGINTLIDLKTVGKNLQEQTMSALGARGKEGFDPQGEGPSNCIAYPNIRQLFGNNAQNSINKINSNLANWANSQAGSALSSSALQQIYQVQANLIINNNAPVAELFYNTGWPDVVSLNIWQLLPFSRGTVKITSTNPFQKPQIRVNYFSVDWDMDVQIAASRLSRRIFTTLCLMVKQVPGGQVPDGSDRGSDANWRNWINNNFSPVAHPIGTAAMMKRSLGGVVNAQLKVYDTANVRVVDASAMPLQVSAHLQATLYGFAEKAADLIKAAN
ncbi:glucose oxidase [Moniliophthora roreri MCA 2997]|uniref:Glucose oxidase n=1 Tax=Moniliophthora roreri (strain MCA 2997) TaxID=1381753 RepID=V2X3R7_MONRO|nr:glucose oxidase [Moniliophthora roreri MCA 2997]